MNHFIFYLVAFGVFQMYFSEWDIPLNRLKQMTNIFMVAPENVQALLQDSKEVNQLDEKTVRQLIRCRTDYKQCVSKENRI